MVCCWAGTKALHWVVELAVWRVYWTAATLADRMAELKAALKVVLRDKMILGYNNEPRKKR